MKLVIKFPKGLYPTKISKAPLMIRAVFPSEICNSCSCIYTAKNIDILVGGATIKGKFAKSPNIMHPNPDVVAVTTMVGALEYPAGYNWS